MSEFEKIYSSILVHHKAHVGCGELTFEACEAIIDHIRTQDFELARRDEIIARLKENGERLAARPYPFIDVEHVESGTYCHYCHKSNKFDHTPDCPITLHRALMKELE